jgi:hypothetical protein
MFGPTLRAGSLPVVVVQPGRRADAVFTVGDNPGPGESRCGAYHSLDVTAPGSARHVVISTWFESLGAWLPACTRVSLSPVVAAAELFDG